MKADEAVNRLRKLGNPRNREGMARYGIQSGSSFGISVPKLRALAREIGKDHVLAIDLWKTGLHDARQLAAMVDDPSLVTTSQMDA